MDRERLDFPISSIYDLDPQDPHTHRIVDIMLAHAQAPEVRKLSLVGFDIMTTLSKTRSHKHAYSLPEIVQDAVTVPPAMIGYHTPWEQIEEKEEIIRTHLGKLQRLELVRSRCHPRWKEPLFFLTQKGRVIFGHAVEILHTNLDVVMFK